MDRDFLVYLGIVVVLALVMSAVARRRARQRREALTAFAASRGFRFTDSDPSLVSRFEGFPFGRGFGRRAINVLHGTHAERPLVAFDYSYKQRAGSGKNRRTSTYHYAVVAVSLGVALPDLAVSPEGFLGRMVGRITGNDIELESEEFNRAFTVTCDDRKFASDVLHPRMMELLLQRTDLGRRFERDSMLVVSRGRFTGEDIDARLASMDVIADAVPEFVWRQVRGRGGLA